MLPQLVLIAQDPPASPQGTGLGSPLFLFLGLLAIFYFLMIRPQMKEQKRRSAMLSALKKNDKVLTTGGMFGIVAAIDGDVVVLKIDDNNNIRARFARTAIASVVATEEASPAPAGKK